MTKLKIFGTRQNVTSPVLVEKFLYELIETQPKYPEQLEHRKRRFSKQNECAPFQNRDLVVMAKKLKIEIPASLAQLLQKRAVRTISGVSPIGILTKPYPCPGRCVYCPTEDRMPKSYMKNQPAAARALRNNFHPHKQVKNRIIALEESGHPVSKLEVIVMGGTWSFLPHKYQSWYVKKIFDAANGASEVIRKSLSAKTLKQAQKINETSDRRVIGLTLETRPDFITERELVRMRRYGCTRIEIGVQTLDDDVQKLTKRGHDRRHVFRAMRLMKDFGFKVCWHIMPGLPGSTPEKDLAVMKEVFDNEECQPDFIKIYPCVVLETAELKQWWKDGRYEPYRDEEIVKLLVKFQTIVPPWVRIMRLMRDIPVSNILDGAKFSNLRQILTQQPQKLRQLVGDDFFTEHGLDKKGVQFMDIRAREVGFKDLIANPDIVSVPPVLKRRNYRANGGDEVFLSFESEDEKTIFALLRLRKPSGQKFEHFGSVLHNAALIREVHSYGTEISVGEEAGLGQHRGLGKRLIVEAEKIAREEWDLPRMTIIAGVGTREYYRKWGYELRSTYMTKKL
jgi:elongator complex protein 3